MMRHSTGRRFASRRTTRARGDGPRSRPPGLEALEARQLLSVTITNGQPAGSSDLFSAVIDRGGSSSSIVFGTQGDTVFSYAPYFEIGGQVRQLQSLGSDPTLQNGTAVSQTTITLTGGGTVRIDVKSSISPGSGLLVTEYAFTASAGVDLRTGRFFQYLDTDIGSAGDDVLTVSGSVAANNLNLKTIDPTTLIQSSQLLRSSLVNAQASGFGARAYSGLRTAITNGGYNPPPEGDITLAPKQVAGLGDVFGPADVTTAIAYSFTNASTATIRTLFSNYDLISVPDDEFRVYRVSPERVIDDGVDRIQIIFTRDVDPATVDASDFAFVGPDDVVPFTGLEWIAPNHLVLPFNRVTQPGEYSLLVHPTISDVDGALLNQDGDALGGENFEDRYRTQFAWDRVNPYVFHTAPWTNTGAPVSAITLYFNEDIDPASFTTADILQLTGPGGTDLRGAVQSVTVTGNVATIALTSQAASGSYSLLLGPDIRDLSNNPLDQNHDGTPGTNADRFSLTFVASGVDLAVRAGSIQFDPTAVLAGQPLAVQWAVENRGDEATPAGASWSDYVYLSTDDIWSLDDTLLGFFTYDPATRGVLAPGGQYTGTLTAALGGLVEGNYRVIVRSNLNREIAEREFNANRQTSTGSLSVSVEALTPGGAADVSPVLLGDRLYYRVTVAPADAGKALVLDFSTADASAANTLFVARERIPTPSDSDRSYTTPPSSSAQVVWHNAAAGVYYVLAATDSSASVRNRATQATVAARMVSFGILDSGYGVGGTAGQRTIEVHGVNLTPNVTVRLVNPAGGPSYDAISTRPVDGGLMFATFDLTGVPAGTYDVVFTVPAGPTATVAGGLTVTVAPVPAPLVPTITAPTAFRRPRHDGQIDATTYPFTVSWRNDSLNDIPLAVLEIRSNEPFVTSRDQVGPGAGAYSMRIWGTPEGVALPGVLRPGESVTRTFYVVPNTRIDAPTLSPVAYYARQVFEDPSAPLDWEPIDRAIRDAVPSGAVEAVGAALRAQIGTTVGDYTRFLVARAALEDGQRTFEAFEASVLRAEARTAWAATTTSITGRVDPGGVVGSPEGLQVVARRNDNAVTRMVRVLSDGSFLLADLPAGTYTISVAGQAIAGGDRTIAVAQGERITGLNLTLAASSQLSGAVTLLSNGQAVAGATVTIYSTTNQRLGSATTDASGKYTVTGIAPGTNVVVQVDALGFARATAARTAAATTVADFALKPQATLRANLVVPSGHTLAEISVSAAVAGNPRGTFLGMVQANGTIVVPGLAPGVYDLTFAGFNILATLTGRTIGDGQTDLGQVQLAALAGFASTPAPRTDAITPTAAGPWATPPGIIYENPPLAMLPVLLGIETELFVGFLSVMQLRWGIWDAILWEDFLNGDPRSPRAIQTFGAGHDIVEGSLVSTGFRYSEQIKKWAQAIVQKVAAAVTNYYGADPQRVCDDAALGRRHVTLDELLQGTSYLRQTVLGQQDIYNPVNFGADGIGTLPGNLAGGPGSGDLYADTRTMSGGFDIEVKCDGSITITPLLHVNVRDTVDFRPGDIGQGLEQVATRQLDLLERYGWAHDVTFDVDFDIRKEDIGLGDVYYHKRVKGCEAPDPCADPVGYRRWLAACSPGSTSATSDCGSYDPNDILGPTGYGIEGWIHETTALNYMIRFENDAKLASAPAGLVTVTQQLDSDLDWRSFRLGTIGFGSHTVDAAQGRASYQGRLDLRDEFGIYLDVTAGIDVNTGLATWELRSIDPETGQLPFNPLLGFLPPNRDGGEGQGFLNYSILPKSGFVTGTRIDAEAEIVFDFNDPIDTPRIANTFDMLIPSSAVLPLPATVGTDILVRWGGTDVGSGIRSYDVFVSADGGPFTVWLTDFAPTEATYTGQPGHRYAFYSLARDNTGHIEAAPAGADAQTSVPVNVATAIVVNSAPNPSRLGEAVTFTATVQSTLAGLGVPVGRIQFAVDGVAFGAAVTLVNGTATSPPITGLTVGNHAVTAAFLSDTALFAAGNAGLAGGQVVNRGETTTVVRISAAVSTFGQAVTLEATVSPTRPGGPVPNGTVQFVVDGVAFGPAVALVNGTATFPNAILGAGLHTVSAQFSGGPNYTPSGGTAPSTLAIARATPTLAWSNPADLLAGTPLGGGQLNATASVPGSFAYSPAFGTILGPGAGQALTVVFTPDDTANFEPVQTTVRVNITAPMPPPPPTDTTPPTVTSLVIVKKKNNVTRLIVNFSEPLRPVAVGVFRLVTAGRDRRFGTRDDKTLALKPATFDAAGRSVTLLPRAKVAMTQPLRLIVSGAGALTDLALNALDGNRDGRPGGDAIGQFGTKPKASASASARSAPDGVMTFPNPTEHVRTPRRPIRS